MTPRIARRVTDYYHSAFQIPEANHASFPIVLTSILNIQSHAGENLGGIFEVQPTIGQRLIPLRRIEGDLHDGYCIYNNHVMQRQQTATLLQESNDEVERRGVAQTQNKIGLSQPSTPSLAQRRRIPGDRSNRLLDVTAITKSTQGMFVRNEA
jgi:hypothetical protein